MTMPEEPGTQRQVGLEEAFGRIMKGDAYDREKEDAARAVEEILESNRIAKVEREARMRHQARMDFAAVILIWMFVLGSSVGVGIGLAAAWIAVAS